MTPSVFAPVGAKAKSNFIPACTLVAACCALLLAAATSATAAPTACGSAPQISDGHHITTDLTGAWIAESPSGRQAVLRVGAGNWASDHDGPIGVVGFAMLYNVGAETNYVRVEAKNGSALGFDHGTWSLAGGFQTQGLTTGTIEPGFPGYATIELPPIPAGTVLTNLFALTYDEEGGNSSTVDLHWVDRAPGGTTPAGTTFGADFTVGTCIPGSLPDGAVVAVSLRVPAAKRGGGRLRVSGSVLPAKAGVSVRLEVRGANSSAASALTLLTDPTGSFAASPNLGETSTLRAFAGGVRSGETTVTVTPKTRIRLRRLRSGGVRILGSVSPRLPGRVLLLRSGEYRSSAKTRTRRGAFKFTLRRPKRGRYSAVFIPDKGRAERSNSNKGFIK